jgi:large subunit ribosomal protein L12
MEYVYAALLLHKAGQKVDEGSVKKVLDAAGVKTDEARVKALVASLEGVNIDEAIQKSAVVAAPVAVAPAEGGDKASAAKSDEKKEAEDEKKKEEAAAGLGALFG